MATAARVQLFISCVTAEFRTYREDLRSALVRHNVSILSLEDFIAAGVPTIDTLNTYIQHCDAVIHLVGDMTGAIATQQSLKAMHELLPDLGSRLSPLKSAIETGEPELSYTQWEAYLALYHRKRLLLAVPTATAPRASTFAPESSQIVAQQAHLARLRMLEQFPEIVFGTVDQLAAGLLGSSVLDLLVRAGIAAQAEAHGVTLHRSESRVQAGGQQEGAISGNANSTDKDSEENGAFDVFLSHPHTEARAVELIGSRLVDDHGLRVWLDKWNLIPGQSWQQHMAKGLEQANACAVFIGSNTPSGWFREEIEKALNRQAKDQNFRVIPVILPNGNRSAVDNFLELRTWVEFKEGLEDLDAFHLLVCGVRGLPPGRGVRATEQQNQVFVGLRHKLSRIRELRDEKLIDPEVAIEFQRRLVDDIMKAER